VAHRKSNYSLGLCSNILSLTTEETIFPLVLNLTNRQYDVMLVDTRGVNLLTHVANLDWLVKLC